MKKINREVLNNLTFWWVANILDALNFDLNEYVTSLNKMIDGWLEPKLGDFKITLKEEES